MVTCPTEPGFPPKIRDAVKAAVESSFGVICGEKPVLRSPEDKVVGDAFVAGSISFTGDIPWTYTLVLTRETAPELAQKYFGMDVPFDSPDMGDVVGELANVLAGDVISQLDRRGAKAQMSLPIVARGTHLEFMPDSAPGILRLDYSSKQGPFWLRLVTTQSRTPLARMPGA